MGLYLSQRNRYKSSLSLAESETKAEQLSQQLTHFFELTPSLMAIADRQGYSQKLNPACERVLGYTLAEVSNTPLSDYIHPDDREKFITTINNVQDKNLYEGLLLRFRSKQGDYRYLDVFLALQEEIYFLAALDVTHRETEKERLHLLAYHDRLTGLPNRALHPK